MAVPPEKTCSVPLTTVPLAVPKTCSVAPTLRTVPMAVPPERTSSTPPLRTRAAGRAARDILDAPAAHGGVIRHTAREHLQATAIENRSTRGGAEVLLHPSRGD
jgi:hypothetical protein